MRTRCKRRGHRKGSEIDVMRPKSEDEDKDDDADED